MTLDPLAKLRRESKMNEVFVSWLSFLPWTSWVWHCEKSCKDEPLQRTRREVRDLDSSPRSANEGAEGLSGDPGFTRGWRIEEKEEEEKL